ncbi:hypothetical protein AsAng_0028490 [Aureispira anguillae]|uniref:Uncharacterized protein n=1 Tax=Aureispira anguillae TaxID=2864201 RepID=A0A915YFF0_9BACT|nr:hypothetical protein AsAng_0028490 [Aureispira anguillae]
MLICCTVFPFFFIKRSITTACFFQEVRLSMDFTVFKIDTKEHFLLQK